MTEFWISIALVMLATSAVASTAYLAVKSGAQSSATNLNKLAAAFTLILILLSVALVNVSLNRLYDETRYAADSIVRRSLAVGIEAINIWLLDQMGTLEDIASDPRTIRLTEELLAAHAKEGTLLDNPANFHLRQDFKALSEKTRHIGFFIIAPDYISLGSLRDENIGTTNLISEQAPALLKRAFAGDTVFIPPIVSDVLLAHSPVIKGQNLPATMFIATPIRRSGKVIAVLTERFEPHEVFSALARLGSPLPGASGFAYNREGKLITRLEDEDGSQILARDLGDKFRRTPKELALEVYKNSEGVEVLGATVWLNEYKIGIANEVPLREAMANYYDARRVVITMLAVAITIAIAMTLALLRYAQQSHQRVEHQRQKLAVSNQELSDKHRNMEDFLYTVSHDLRAPLITISTFADRLLANTREVLTDKQQHELERILLNAEQMDVMLLELIKISRVANTQIDPVEIDATSVVTDVIHSLAGMIETNGVEVAIEPLMAITGDETLVRHCTENLMTNAIKYRHPNRPLKVRIYSSATPDKITLNIEDNGMGIKESDRHKIFKVFERVASAEIPGTGVGLNIVQAAMEKMGGSVEFSSSDEGTTFTLNFPRNIHKD